MDSVAVMNSHAQHEEQKKRPNSHGAPPSSTKGHTAGQHHTHDGSRPSTLMAGRSGVLSSFPSGHVRNLLRAELLGEVRVRRRQLVLDRIVATPRRWASILVQAA